MYSKPSLIEIEVEIDYSHKNWKNRVAMAILSFFQAKKFWF